MPVPLKPHAPLWQRLVDHLLFPVNMWLGEEGSRRLGLTPIDHERVRAALPYCRGLLLDVGCGKNLLVRSHGAGFGVDVHPYVEISARCDSSRLPFKAGSFDTVALLACLNHMVRREETLAECHRVLRRDGRLLVTMISPWVGCVSHRIRRRHDPDQLERGMAHEEAWGLAPDEVIRLLERSRFELLLHRRFMWGLNSIFVARSL